MSFRPRHFVVFGLVSIPLPSLFYPRFRKEVLDDVMVQARTSTSSAHHCATAVKTSAIRALVVAHHATSPNSFCCASSPFSHQATPTASAASLDFRPGTRCCAIASVCSLVARPLPVNDLRQVA